MKCIAKTNQNRPCKNDALGGTLACGIKKHKEQVESLPWRVKATKKFPYTISKIFSYKMIMLYLGIAGFIYGYSSLAHPRISIDIYNNKQNVAKSYINLTNKSYLLNINNANASIYVLNIKTKLDITIEGNPKGEGGIYIIERPWTNIGNISPRQTVQSLFPLSFLNLNRPGEMKHALFCLDIHYKIFFHFIPVQTSFGFYYNKNAGIHTWMKRQCPVKHTQMKW